jgi:hypothetical protein
MRRTESTAMLCTPMLFVPLGFGPSPCTPSQHDACTTTKGSTSILQESGMASLRRPASSSQEEQGMRQMSHFKVSRYLVGLGVGTHLR